MKRDTNELLDTFENQLRNALNIQLSLSNEEILNDILAKQVRNTGLEDSISTKLDIKVVYVCSLVKIYESREQSGDIAKMKILKLFRTSKYSENQQKNCK